MASWEQTYANGRIPLAALTQVAPGVYMQPDVAIRVARMGSAFLVAVGLPLKSIEGYRDFARQVFYRNEYLAGRGNPAAIPGTSPHGMALANDFAWPMTSWTTAGQVWFRAHAADYEQSSAQGLGDDEPWHKVDTGNHTTTTPAGGGAIPIGEPEMKEQALSFQDVVVKSLPPGGIPPKGGPVYMRTKDNKADQNIAGSVGSASYKVHVYATGTPGDVVELVLIRENINTKPTPSAAKSPHYTQRMVIDKDGQLKDNRSFQMGTSPGGMAFVQLWTPATNKGTVTITLVGAETNTLYTP